MTDALGSFVVGGVEPGIYRITLVGEAGSWIDEVECVAGRVDAGTYILRETAPVCGVLLDRAGHAVASSLVYAMLGSEILATVRTDEAGAFVIRGLPARPLELCGGTTTVGPRVSVVVGTPGAARVRLYGEE